MLGKAGAGRNLEQWRKREGEGKPCQLEPRYLDRGEGISGEIQ